MNELPIALTNHGLTIRGMAYLPDHGQGRHPVVLMLHGLGGNRIEFNNLFELLARHLASLGIAAVAFNFRNTKDSDGELGRMVPSDEVDDAVAVSHWLAAQPFADPDRLALLGISMGGMIAACAVGRVPEDFYRTLVLLNPTDVNNICRIIGEFRVDRKPGERFTYGANKLHPDFVRDAHSLRPLQDILRFPYPTLLVQGAEDAAVNPVISDQYADVRRAAGLPIKQVLQEGANHSFTKPEQKEKLFPVVAAWLGQQLQVDSASSAVGRANASA
ncbi:MAG: alpha/beta fold hydrolase [Phycisphaeraceae bacterium]|nr:alpha/beta fold hydrolase [Phycisphaeraceae bacterium]